MIFRHISTGLFCLFILLSFHISCSAGTTEEIANLLQYIEESKCTFIRNGNQYNSLAAREHIEKKYNYYKKRITTAEEFIQYSATKSTLTGKPYKVFCDEVGMNSSDWLNVELDKMRAR